VNLFATVAKLAETVRTSARLEWYWQPHAVW